MNQVCSNQFPAIKKKKCYYILFINIYNIIYNK